VSEKGTQGIGQSLGARSQESEFRIMNSFNDKHYYINRRIMMCETHAYLLKEDGEEMLMENVDLLEVEGDEIRMVDIFGEQKILKARIRSYNGPENRILLESIG